jgi:hypothetical protein
MLLCYNSVLNPPLYPPLCLYVFIGGGLGGSGKNRKGGTGGFSQSPGSMSMKSIKTKPKKEGVQGGKGGKGEWGTSKLARGDSTKETHTQGHGMGGLVKQKSILKKLFNTSFMGDMGGMGGMEEEEEEVGVCAIKPTPIPIYKNQL